MPCGTRLLTCAVLTLAAAGLTGPAFPDALVTYTYDAAGRLTSASYGDSLTTTYTYDPAGNLIARETVSGILDADAGAIDGTSPRPTTYDLAPLLPNPMRSATHLAFQLPRPSRVALEVFDVTGRQVRSLLAGDLPAGFHRLVWDGRDGEGRPVSSGRYFVRIRAGSFERIRVLTAIR